ncbi:probable serine/threonine-protein kinase PBL21 isoform X1 [Tripterygium wilfordii]|uniref:probable serine/threonine-protein kinase PBL21 isoform X1 n=1 Tax=Tripterygium wilfordii TaxID=458696 RepID=UPI0018F7FC8A|nr:probable serine/threonine-protein kinase PBL21 isoform X1 [Tripterygium wilfordii]XP_038714032.1 probable serine/threonine-protein kinase PBL21 isoform X1 [Tripterygium wilfordii]
MESVNEGSMESVNEASPEELDGKELELFTTNLRFDALFTSPPEVPDWERFVKFAINLDNGCRVPEKFKWNDLKMFTNNFSEKNFIDWTQFCKVYRGRTLQGQEVTVKIWVPQDVYTTVGRENVVRLQQEVIFLSRIRDHPYLVKLIGYCCDDDDDDHIGVVYDLNSVDTLHKLIKQDSFTWQTRLNVALKFASVIEFLHSYEPKYFVCNIDAAHVMLDQDSNPVLFDFAMLVGGIFGYTPPDISCKRRPLCGSFGYIDPQYFDTGIYTEWTDVFAFGVVLLMLISKRVWDRDSSIAAWQATMQGKDRGRTVQQWALEKYSQLSKRFWCKNSLVHKSLKRDPGFDASRGVNVTELAIRCVQKKRYGQWPPPPKIAEVVSILRLWAVADAS